MKRRDFLKTTAVAVAVPIPLFKPKPKPELKTVLTKDFKLELKDFKVELDVIWPHDLYLGWIESTSIKAEWKDKRIKILATLDANQYGFSLNDKDTVEVLRMKLTAPFGVFEKKLDFYTKLESGDTLDVSWDLNFDLGELG